MKMKQLCASMIWMLLFSSLCCSQTVDPLNFQFRDVPDFRWVGAGSSQMLGYNSKEMVNGKPVLFVSKLQTDFTWEPLRSILEQTILLSDNSGGVLNLSIHNRTCNLQKAVVIVRTYNEREQILREDSVNILSGDKWKENKLMLPAHPFRFIRVIIKSLGTSEPADYKDDYQYLALDQIELLVNGKSINQPSCLQKNLDIMSLALKSENVHPLTDKMLFSVTPFRDKKIIGLGETMHQNGSIKEVVFDILRKQIEQNNCRLILLEYPMDAGLMLNWYVSGKAPEDFIDVIGQYSELGYDRSFIDFMYWLRNYNSNNPEQRVRLLGMDACSLVKSNPNETFLFASQYLTRILFASIKQGSAFGLSGLARKVVENKYKEAQAEMQLKQSELIEVLGEDNFNVLQEILRQLNELIPEVRTKDYFAIFNKATERDYQMFLNYEKFSSLFLKPGETSVLYAHLAHLAKSQTYTGESLGAYLSKKYLSSYFSIGLIAGTGTSTMMYNTPIISRSDTLMWNPCYNFELETPASNSLEAAAMKVPYENFFYSFDAADNKSSEIGLMKIIPNGIPEGKKFAQFLPVSYCSWMDGFIFIRNVTPFLQPKDISFARKEMHKRIQYREELSYIMGVEPRR